MLVNDIAKLNLHDSEVLRIEVDRREKEKDRIIFYLDYVVDYSSMNTSPKLLVFSGCWKAVFNCNFGVISPDMLSFGSEIENSELIEQVKEVFTKLRISPPDGIKHYHLKTNTTNSSFDLVAEQMELLDSDELF